MKPNLELPIQFLGIIGRNFQIIKCYCLEYSFVLANNADHDEKPQYGCQNENG